MAYQIQYNNRLAVNNKCKIRYQHFDRASKDFGPNHYGIQIIRIYFIICVIFQ